MGKGNATLATQGAASGPSQPAASLRQDPGPVGATVRGFHTARAMRAHGTAPTLEHQLRLVTTTYRHERLRGTPQAHTALRARCLEILDGIADATARYPKLMDAMVAVRQELERDELLAANGLGEQAVDPVSERVD
jgi:hypothetical protein